ncbi:hypothetical protein [Zunongwangia sp. HGR-M22]|uniref:hypothetical protein n=1 Tax=Zunongwangia sp. HGR-M22 TaxID=3015168 RepID=UPI0022DDCDD3|nr:hypothetical protein [Zunongwangia sp. HGR-M22]WBL25872.1 hypothetical protein PBT91_00935 [Zunongwangia sp. HGR-M22]
MKEDIEIPKVEKIHVAAVREFNEAFQAEEWNAYIINNKNVTIEMILIVSKGYDGKKETSVMRHKLEKLPPHSFAKIEFIQDEVLQLNNEYQITFFVDNKMFEKTFIFKKNSVKEDLKKEIPLIPKLGILAE